MKKTFTLILAAAALSAGFAQAAPKDGHSRLQRNKANVLAFYDLAFNKHQPEEAVKKYVAEPYIQHNPTVADGGKAFVEAFAPFLKENPQSRAEVKRVVAEGDLVVLHVFSRTSPQDRGEAVVDIFRVDKAGKIVEHWDVIQPVPEKTVSGHSVF
ncbi:Predicted ester cyclase [Kingella potus]|uniref:Predicted ester cyclase n=1 Tax=Kingella potus TaxID=265175 RepID=A0A377R2U9_9NEIS|nr:nuclear transport factor 2 family protein [Kingella potus]STR02579.1 Predicted ester cyclase [Kingella potus]